MVAILLLSGCTNAQRAVAPVEPVGWYELHPGHQALVTWGPTEGLRLLDFDSANFAVLRPLGGDRYAWRLRDDIPVRTVHFVTGEDGRGALIWTDSTGGRGNAPQARDYPFDQRLVTFTSREGTRLTGVLLVPRGPSGASVDVPMPAVAMIHGSGASDRDNVWAFHIAQHIARNGTVVLLPDKRGSGASEGDWRTASLELLAHDALAAHALLRAVSGVDPARVGLVGLSQGGWIAPLAGRTSPDVAFVISVSAAAVHVYEQVRHEIEQDLRQNAELDDDVVASLLRLVDLQLAFAERGGGEAWQAYADAREASLAGPLASMVQRMPADSTSGLIASMRVLGNLDPLPLWRALDRPALIVYGEDDERDNVPVAESVRRLERLPAVRSGLINVRVFEDTGHAFGDDETGWIRADFLSLLANWIRTRAGSAP